MRSRVLWWVYAKEGSGFGMCAYCVYWKRKTKFHYFGYCLKRKRGLVYPPNTTVRCKYFKARRGLSLLDYLYDERYSL